MAPLLPEVVFVSVYAPSPPFFLCVDFHLNFIYTPPPLPLPIIFLNTYDVCFTVDTAAHMSKECDPLLITKSKSWKMILYLIIVVSIIDIPII